MSHEVISLLGAIAMGALASAAGDGGASRANVCLSTPCELQPEGWAGGRLMVAHDRAYDGPWPEDQFVLSVFFADADKILQAQWRFRSTYGKFEISTMDLDGDRVEEVLVVEGKYRGTNVRAEHLHVLKRDRFALREILAVQVSGFFGVGQWRYKRQFIDINEDGAKDLVLVLGHDDVEQSRINDGSLIPKERELAFVYNTPRDEMVPYYTKDR